MAVYEFLVIAVLLGASAWMFYLYAHKATEANTFKDKAQQHQLTISNNGFRLFDFSCVPKSVMDKWGEDATVNKTHS